MLKRGLIAPYKLVCLMWPQHPRVHELLPLCVVPLLATLVPLISLTVEVVLVGQVLDPCRQLVLLLRVFGELERKRCREGVSVQEEPLGPPGVFGNAALKLLPPLSLPFTKPMPSQVLPPKYLPIIRLCVGIFLPSL